MRKEVEGFLTRHGMHYNAIDMDKEVEGFRLHMQKGLDGADDALLLMIPTFITVDGEVPKGREVIVMDAGGTNFRVATVKLLENGEMEIGNFSKNPMPGTYGKLSFDEFFGTLVDYLEPVMDKCDSEAVGFCFSFATEMYPSKDGRLKHFSKEVQAEGVEGSMIGESINAELEKRGRRKLKFALLNDTVATMLGGMAAAKGGQYAGYIGYILGTGTNTCYLESCANIKKSPEAHAMAGQMAINMESGEYNGFTQGDYDKELDNESVNPGRYQMEKMMSGAYQGTLLYKTVRGAAEEGVFSPEFAGKLKKLDTFTMPQVDGFLKAPEGDNELAGLCGENAEDRQSLYDIFDAITERAARMAAIVFASILLHCGDAADPQKPYCVTAEGTFFTKSVLFPGKLDTYVKDYLNGKLGVYCDIVNRSDVTLTGSAIAALTE